MNEKMLDLRHQIKDNISQLVNLGKIDAAKALISEYELSVKNDIEICSIKAVIAIMEGKLQDAEGILKYALSIDSSNFDINYNLAYVYGQLQNFNEAYSYYKKALELCKDDNIKNEINSQLDSILKEHKEEIREEKKKIAFFVKQGMDSFLGDIIDGLSDDYETRKIIVTQYNQIDEGMKWTDICWFEWCDELVIYGSKAKLAKSKSIICRLHSYEAFTDYIHKVNWSNIDKLILVSEHIMSLICQKINISKDKLIVVHNGIDLMKLKFRERAKGYNIAYLGYINFKKGPMLLLHAFKAIYDRDHRYRLYIAGKFQEERYVLYFEQMIKEMGLQNNIFFEGWQDDVDKWLEDKDYILSTSLLESQAMGIMQAMSKGIKPIIHNFVGAKTVYDSRDVWSSIDECVHMVVSDNYESKQYRDFIQNNYSLNKQITELKGVIGDLKVNSEKTIINIVKNKLNRNIDFRSINNLTVIIPTYNRAGILKNELISGYKLGLQNKVIIDDCSDAANKKIIDKIVQHKDKYGVEQVMLHDSNKGVAQSICDGVNVVKTKYIQFCDDDDIIICMDRDKFAGEIQDVGKQYIFMIPRYIVNLFPDNTLHIGYDRSLFDGLMASDVLKYMCQTGEMLAMKNGSILKTDDAKLVLPEQLFKVSEDYVMISRALSKSLNKRIKISDSYVYVRRIWDNTLTKKTNDGKLFLNVFSMLVSGYYCIKYNLISCDEFFNILTNRAKVLQKYYGVGEVLIDPILKYLRKEIEYNKFISLIKQKNFISEICDPNIPNEVKEIISFF